MEVKECCSLNFGRNKNNCHAEFVSVSSWYDKNRVLKSVIYQTPNTNISGRGLMVEATVQGDKRNGFTLIELLVVILIIGILVAVALPQYQKAINKAKYAHMLSIANAMAKTSQAYFLEHGKYPNTLDELEIDLPNFKKINSKTYCQGRSRKDICISLNSDYKWLNISPYPGGRENSGYRYHMKRYERYGVWADVQPGIYCFQAVSWGSPDGMCAGEPFVSDAYGTIYKLK